LYRPFIDSDDRIATVKKYLASHPDVVVEKATKASFEYKDKDAFEKEFAGAVIAILQENSAKAVFLDERYMIVDPLNRFHTSDVETFLLPLEKSSRCGVRKVGAVVIHNGKIIGQGCNTCMCLDNDECEACAEFLRGNIAVSRMLGCGGIHAEIAAIESMTPQSVEEEYILLSTTAPCVPCAEHIVKSGIKKVVYLSEWKRTSLDQKDSFVDTSGIDVLKANNVHRRKAGV
jgi:dCMP deaminase